jgi:hypothetical protein
MLKRRIIGLLIAVTALPARWTNAQETFAGSRTLLEVRLERAYLPCLFPSLQHQPPFALPACPAIPASMFGYQDGRSGHLTVRAVLNSMRQVSDVQIKVAMTGVQTDAGVLVDDGVFQLVAAVRITDRGCAGAPCTLEDLSPLVLGAVRCGRNADPVLPSGRCQGVGSLNGQVGGFVTPGSGGTLQIGDIALLSDGQLAFVPGTIIP